MLDVQERKMLGNTETALLFDALDAVKAEFVKRGMWPTSWDVVAKDISEAMTLQRYISANEMVAVAKGIVWKAGGAEMSSRAARARAKLVEK